MSVTNLSTEKATVKYEKVPKKKKKRCLKYIYTFGDNYPKQLFGHKNCIESFKDFIVPANMGWLWTSSSIKGEEIRSGWKPGSISRTLRKMMNIPLESEDSDLDIEDFRAFGLNEENALSQEMKSEERQENKEEAHDVTLLVARRGDIFTVTVRPLKDLAVLQPGESTYVDCDPVVFRIGVKRSPERLARRAARKDKELREKCEKEIHLALEKVAMDICKTAFQDVYCHDPSALDEIIAKIPDFGDDDDCDCDECPHEDGSGGSDSSSSSGESEWDIEYSPPLGSGGPEPREADLVHVETQYDDQDWKVKQSEGHAKLRRRMTSTQQGSIKAKP